MHFSEEDHHFPPPEEGATEPFSPLPEEEAPRITLLYSEEKIHKWATRVFVECNEAVVVEELRPSEHADVLRALCRELQAPHPGIWDAQSQEDALGSPLHLFSLENQEALRGSICHLHLILENEVHELLWAQRNDYSHVDFTENYFTFVREIEKRLITMVYDPRLEF